MKQFCLFFLMMGCLIAKAQTDTTVRYFNAALEPVSRKTESAYTGKIYPAGGGWNAFIINNSGQLVLHGSYRDKALQTKNGLFTYFYPDGKKQVEGLMENNQQQGCWKSWHTNGRLKDSVFFTRGAKNGPSYSWFENGNPKFTGSYLHNNPSGDWNWYYENGNPSTKEKYVNQKLSSLECFDSSGKYSGFQCGLETTPTIKGKYGGIHKFIIDSLLYPADALKRNIEGVVQVEFTVTRNGEMQNLLIIKTPDKILADEVIRVIMLVPGWYPALEHNRPIDYVMKLNIPFYRDQDDRDF